MRPFGSAALLVSFLAAVTIFSGCEKPGARADRPLAGSRLRVVVAKAGREPVTESLSLTGTVLANESAEVRAEAGGRVAGIHFEEGKRVERDQLLIEIAADSEAGPAAKATAVRAAFRGVTGARLVSPGQVVAPRQALTTLFDLEPVKVSFAVPERSMSQVRAGQKVTLDVAAYPGAPFTGEVYFIAPRIDPMSRTGLVQARLANPELRLRPGMTASLKLTLRVRDDAVVIPEAALFPRGGQTAVFIVDDAMLAQPRAVTVGLRAGGRAEILDGLRGGENVVVEGWQRANPGMPVTLAPTE